MLAQTLGELTLRRAHHGRVYKCLVRQKYLGFDTAIEVVQDLVKTGHRRTSAR